MNQTMTKLIDAHAHLDQLDDIAAALRRAKDAGVFAIVASGVSLPSNKSVLSICREYKELELYPAIGIHPGNLAGEDIAAGLLFIENNIADVVCVGETGLDYWYKQASKQGPGREFQQEVFAKQLDIACKHDKPVLVHSRGAWSDCLKMLVEKKVKKALFHWYSGPEDILAEILEAGYFISATPSTEYSHEQQTAVKRTPLEKLLIETDSPVVYKPESGKYSAEPQDVLRTLRSVSKIKRIPESVVMEHTGDNAMRFFGLNT